MHFDTLRRSCAQADRYPRQPSGNIALAALGGANTIVAADVLRVHARGPQRDSGAGVPPLLKSSLYAFFYAAAVSAAGVALPAFAAGLGEIVLRSHLGQALRAEIDLVAVDPAEREQLQVRIASFEAHQRANVEFAPTLQSLRVSLARRANGGAFVRITSGSPINEPFLHFLVELGTQNGLISRAYTVLLDPPGAIPNSAPIELPNGAINREREPMPRVERRSTSSSTDASAVPGHYVVQPGDSLSKIALDQQHDGVNLQQMMAALFRANEGAFIEGNIDRLVAGRTLRIPTAEEVRAGTHADSATSRSQGADAAGRRAAPDLTRSALVPPQRLPAADDSHAAPDTEIRSSRLERLEPPTRPSRVPRDRLTLAPPPSAPDPAAEAAERLVQRSRARVFELENRMDELLSTLKTANEKIAQLNREMDTIAARRGTAMAQTPRADSPATPEAVAASTAQAAAPPTPSKPLAPSLPAVPPAGSSVGSVDRALEVVPPGLVLMSPTPADVDPALLSFADRARGRLVPIVGSLVVLLGLLLLVLRWWLRSRVEAADDGAVYSGAAVEEMLAIQKEEDHWQPLAPDSAEAMVTMEVDLNIGESAGPARTVDSNASRPDQGVSHDPAPDDNDGASRLSPLGNWSARLLSARRGAASTRPRRSG